MGKPKLGLVAGYGVSLLGGIVALAVYARVLGPFDYGRFAVYLAVVEAIQIVVFQWHRLAAVRFWVQNEGKQFASFIATYNIVWLAIALGVVVGVCLYNTTPWGRDNDVWPLVIALAVAKSAALYAQELARAEGASLRYALGAILLTVGAALLGVLAYRQTHSISAVLIATTLTLALSAALSAGPIAVRSRSGRFQKKHLPEMLRYGLPLIPVFLASAALTRLDRPIISQFESASIVGVYAAAAALITNVVSAAFLLVVTPAYPWLLREQGRLNEKEFRNVHIGVGGIMICTALCISIGFYCTRSLVLPMLLGEEIGIAAMPLTFPLLSISIIGAFRAHFFDQAFHLFKKTNGLMFINFMVLLVALVALYIGAYFGGLRGMIVGLAVANVISMGLSVFACRNFVEVWPLARLVAKILALGCVLVIAGEASTDYFQSVSSSRAASSVVVGSTTVAAFACICYVMLATSIRKLLQGRS